MAGAAAWERVVTDLVARRGPALMRYATLLCGDREQAADLVQDALLKTFGRLRNGFDIDSAESYVRAAIRHGYLDSGRRLTLWRRTAPREYRPDEEPSPAPAIDARLDVLDELRHLSPRERSCLVLRYYDDLTVDAIADRLGVSAGAVKRYLSDGLSKLAARPTFMNQEGGAYDQQSAR